MQDPVRFTLAIIVGVLLLRSAAMSLKRGYRVFLSKKYQRDAQPVGFWMLVAADFTGAAICAIYVARQL
jgi:hypothetical protein